MPAKHTLQSLRVRGPATFDQAIRVKGEDWPPDQYISAEDIADLDARKLEKSANLSDLASAPAARGHLELGSAATLNAPAAGNAAAGELVRGNDSRLIDARAPLAHNHSAADINAGVLAAARGGTGYAGGTWSSYTPIVTAYFGSITSASAVGRYVQIGKIVIVRISITITSSGNGSGAVLATLPVSASNVGSQNMSGRESAVTRKALNGLIVAGDNKVQITLYDGSYHGASGYTLEVQGIYEAS